MTPDHRADTYLGPHLRIIPGGYLVRDSRQRVFSIFYQEPVDLHDLVASCDERAIPDIAKPGWYWEDANETPVGPFRTSALAYVDATKGNYP